MALNSPFDRFLFFIKTSTLLHFHHAIDEVADHFRQHRDIRQFVHELSARIGKNVVHGFRDDLIVHIRETIELKKVSTPKRKGES